MLVDKLQVIEDKFMDLEQRISDPEVIARQDEWRKLTRQHAQLSETVETFRIALNGYRLTTTMSIG